MSNPVSNLRREPFRALSLAVLLVHLTLVLPAFHGREFRPTEWSQNGVYLCLGLGVAALGRLALSYLPPGEPGLHGPGDLASTLAVSAVLGGVVLGLGYVPLVALRLSAGAALGVVYALPVLALVVAAGLRWLTLPGAMVPRHRPAASPPGTLERALLAGLALWFGYAFLTRAFVAALVWLVIGVLVARALLQARRPLWGALGIAAAIALLGNPGGGSQSDLFGLCDELGVAAGLSLGAAGLVSWVRRADRRALALSAIGFALPLLRCNDPLGPLGLAALLAASRRSQRRRAAPWVVGSALLFSLPHLIYGPLALPGSFDPLELGRLALRWSSFGLAWPLAALGLLLGIRRLRRAGLPWRPGSIEEPRRELAALLGLLVATPVAWTLGRGPWDAADALVILLPLAMGVAGLALLPPEPAEPAGT